MFFGSAEKLDIARGEGAFPWQPSGTRPAPWRAEKSRHWHWSGPGTALSCRYHTGWAVPEAFPGPVLHPSRALPPTTQLAAGKLQASGEAAAVRVNFPSGQTRRSQRLGHLNPHSPPVRGMAPR